MEGTLNFNDRFIDSDVHAGASLYRCMTCGAVVEDTVIHEEWHQEIDRDNPQPPMDTDIKT
jgi:hypothetical protein